MRIIDCLCCGSALALPDGVKDGQRFACARCGMALRNVAFVRDFRWDAQDPYLRKHGVSRGNLWGALIGSSMWLIVLTVLMVVRGKFSLGLLVAIAVPYLALLAALRVSRPRRPAVLWMMQLWMGLGAYCLYLAGLQMLLSGFADVMKGVTDVSPALLAGLGGGWLATGLVGTWLYRRSASRLPQAQVAPAATSPVGASGPAGSTGPSGPTSPTSPAPAPSR